MNKNKRLNIIIRTLAMPFIDFEFFESDPLGAKALCYEKLLNDSGIRADQKRKYQKSREKIIFYIASLTQAERLDDIVQMLNMFYADPKMVRYLKRMGRSAWVESYYVQRIFDISSSLVTLRNGRISIRMWSNDGSDELFDAHVGLHKVEIWSTLVRVMTPDVFIAAYYVNADLSNMDYLSNVTSNVSLCDTPLTMLLKKGIAETHLHLNAGMTYLSIWEAVTDFTQLDVPGAGIAQDGEHLLEQEYHEFPYLFLAGMLRFLMAVYLEEQEKGEKCCDMLDFFEEYRKGHGELFSNILSVVMPGEGKGKRKQAILQLYWDFYQSRFRSIAGLEHAYGIAEDSSVIDLLGRSVYQRYSYLNTSYEILFLYKALYFMRRNPDRYQFMHVFLEYLRIKNDYFMNKLQSDEIKGLQFFMDFFDRATEAPYVNSYGGNAKKEAVYLSIFKEHGKFINLKKLEFKISPKYPIKIVSQDKPDYFKLLEIKRAITKQVLEIFCSYLKYFEIIEAKHDLTIDEIEEKELASFPTIGVVYHFIKADDPDRYLGDICWVSPQSTDVLTSNSIQVVRKRHMEFWDALNEMIRDIPHFGEYIVGIDAAADELSSEPWIFAPIFKYVRHKKNTYPVQIESNRHIQNIGLTYHVGEDYRHILSGLRYIDEVLTHFGYKAGDRLGHALALQVDTQSWVWNNEVVAVPVIEYLENLLWLWYLNNQYPEIKSNTGLDLEKKIMDTAKKVYKNIAGLSPYILWKGYTLKFELLEKEKIELIKDYYSFAENECFFPSQEGELPLKRCFCRNYESGRGSGTVDPIWDEDKLLLTHFCPVYAQHYSEPIFVRTGREEIPLFIAIQDLLKRKIEQAGIYVESNPTSNATIGDIESLLQHPIVNLNSKGLDDERAANVLVTINSDDPLVFNTNVENEIANVYHMLISQGYGREDILAWIDKVRQYGMDSSFIHKVKKPSVQRQELREIVERLKSEV